MRQRLDLGFRAPAMVGRPQHDVLKHRLVREQVEVLEYHADLEHLVAASGCREMFGFVRPGEEMVTVEVHLALLELLQAVQGPDQRCLARSGGPDDRDHLAWRDRDIQSLKTTLAPKRFSPPSRRMAGLADRVARFSATPRRFTTWARRFSDRAVSCWRSRDAAPAPSAACRRP